MKRSDIYRLLETIKQKKPLVHHITNYVVANETANLTLCFGALPVMAQAIEESSEMAAMAGALVLNIGTLNPELVDSMIAAGKTANKKGVPVIFDPVGAGATNLRTESARKILKELKIDIIRGNCAESAVLAGLEAEILGVESLSSAKASEEVAKELSSQTGSVCVVTGPQDIVSFDNKSATINNGHSMMGKITGTGCMSTTAVACFSAVMKDKALACVAAMASFGVAGEIAAENSGDNPGTFHTLLYDAVYNLSNDDLKRIDVISND